ncbi:flagellar basal-body rod protein FlgF [Roseibium litorale]|uniref:Flagellar basal-body rod protein FlgF n=1 Tax=Roseibium litorale TaxID=2803841 RepID=A0ABR9CHW8_9HYPH|nr:flagellar basal-body rod protein FlgF [Roseibium litorale]MBD8890415.1 flagellar basal-body rod protein FlgF [Roseibium litorale]
MENAQLISLSRQIALRNQIDVVASNMANINTTGFKAQRMVFEEVTMPLAEASEFKQSDQRLSYVQDYGTSFNMLQGSVRLTGNELDVAVDGDGWFAIAMPDGSETYTRDGSFKLDNTGKLVTSTGKEVLTDGGPITFTAQDGKITISDDGTISTELGLRGKLKMVSFETPQMAKAIGENLYTYENAIPMRNGKVIQGGLEGSNVNSIIEVAHMIEITRAYETVSTMMQKTDDLRENAISKLGSLRA